MERSQVSGRVWWWLLSAVLLGLLVFRLRTVLSPVLLAWLIAYLLDPLVDRLEALRLPRSVGIVVLLTAAFIGFSLFSLIYLPVIVRDIVALGQQLPAALSRLLSLVTKTLVDLGVELPSNLEEAVQSLGDHLPKLAPSALPSVQAVFSAVLGGTASFLGGMAALVMVPIFTFYLLEDFDRIIERIRVLLPSTVRPPVVRMAVEVDTVIGEFLRGQLLVMGLLAALYAVGYALVGVSLAIPIGLVAGLLSFIPYVGGAVALGLGLLMSVLHYQGVGQLFAVAGVYALIQVLEGFVITPRVVGDKLGLAPVWVLFALMVGGELFGLLGIMLALPTAAVIKVFVMHGLARYKRSALFLGQDSDASPPCARPVTRPLRAPVGRRILRKRRTVGAASQSTAS